MATNKIYNLNDNWFIACDDNNAGKTSGWENVINSNAVPCVIPSIIQQYFPNYHGVAYYWNKFTLSIDAAATDKLFLNFGGADYLAEVWLNGKYLGMEEGGETPFSFDVSNVIKFNEENLLAVRIINPTDKVIDGLTLMNTPHRNKEIEKRAGSNLNHGGLWYGVSVTAVPPVYVSDKLFKGDLNGNLTVNVTVNNSVDGETDCVIGVTVYENDETAAIVAAESISEKLISKSKTVTLNLNVNQVKLWDIDEPNLYKIEVFVQSKYGKHLQIQKFGFREFKTVDGYFYLNGKKIFIKSAHSGNAFPIGQMLPVCKEQARQDFIYAKSCGFNMLRSIAGLFRPEQLDLADELGLLIYEECFASWCMGYSAVDSWKNDDEYVEMLKRHPNVPLVDESEMLRRWNTATKNMISRDKNRTSVVVWGLLNETYESSVYKTAVKFLPTLRKIDDTRLVILSSGRWDNDFSVGCASNPKFNCWQNVWGDDGVFSSIENPDEEKVGDRHYYPVCPLSDESVFKIRNMGANAKYPVFYSEFGVGALFNVIEEYKRFMQNGERLDLEDAAWLKYQAEAFTDDFNRLKLNKIYPFAESFLKDSQRYNADERKRHFDMIRSNNKLCGYSLTGLLDHGMCGEGLWSYWRRWKPLMFDAVSEGWAKLRFCNFVTPNGYSGDEFVFESVLANDGALKSGTYTANFAVYGDEGVVTAFSQTFTVNENDFSTFITKRKIKITAKEGKYYFAAELNEGSPVATTTRFYVYDKPNYRNDKKTYCVGLSQDEKTKLAKLNVCCEEFNAENIESRENRAFILAGTNDVNVDKLLQSASDGSTVLFIDAAKLSEADVERLKKLSDDIKLTNYRDWLYHKEYLLADGEVFNGLGNKMLELTRFGETFAHTTIYTKKTPDDVICPGFLTGYYGVKLGYELNYAALGFNYGKGKVLINCFNILDNLGFCVADKLLINLINKYNK